MEETLFLNEHRCKCGKLLLKGIFFDGTLEIKCRRCGAINKIGKINQADDATHYLLIVDKQGRIVNCSEAAGYVLGYSRDELIGKHLSQISPVSQKEIDKKFFGPESALDEENYFKLDTFHRCKSGKKIPVVALLKLYQPAGREKYLLISAEPKNTESKSNFLKEDAFEFLDNTCDFYLSLDKNGIVEHASPSAAKFFGFTQETFTGRNYLDYLPVGKEIKAKKIFNHFSVNEEPYRVAGDIGISADGEMICDEIYFTPNFNDMGKLVGYCVLGRLKKFVDEKIKPEKKNIF